MRLMRMIVVLFLCSGLGGWNPSQAATDFNEALLKNRVVLITDFDQTLTGPAWVTPWYLYKIPSLQSYLQLSGLQGGSSPGALSFDQLPRKVAITELEFLEQYFNLLATMESNGRITPKSAKKFLLTPVPFIEERQVEQTFIPGVYRLTEESWERFRAQPVEQSYLLEDSRRARKLERAGVGSRFGPSFPLFKALASHRRSVDNIHVVTARGQTPDEFEWLFDEWQRERTIKYSRGFLSTAEGRQTAGGKINIYPVGLGEGLLYGQTITQRKVQLVRDQIIPHYMLLAKQMQTTLVIVVAENEPNTIRAYELMLKEIAGIPDFQKYLEFVLLHAGSESDLRNSGLPGRWTKISNSPLQNVTFSIEQALLQTQNIASTTRNQYSCYNLLQEGPL